MSTGSFHLSPITGSTHFDLVPCPMCGGSRKREVFRYRSNAFRAIQQTISDQYGVPFSIPGDTHFHVFRCSCCGGGYTLPRLNTQGAEKFYTEYYEDVYGPSADVSMQFTHSVYDSGPLPRDFRRAQAVRKRQPHGKTLLDVGCSTGGFLLAAMVDGWQASGVELSSSAAETATRLTGATVYQGSLEQSPFTEGQFDVITMFALIEHLPDPLATLQHAAKLLKRGGILVLQVPSILSLEARVHLLVPDAQRHGYLFEHLTYFSPQSLRAALDQLGLKELEITSKHWDETAGISLTERIRGRLLRRAPLPPESYHPLGSKRRVETEAVPGLELLVEAAFDQLKPALESTSLGGRLCLGNVLVCWAQRR